MPPEWELGELDFYAPAKCYAIPKEIRDERLRQARIAFNASIFLGGAGVLLIFVGVAFLLFTSSVKPATITASIGAVQNVLGVVIYALNREVNKRLDETNAELVRLEKIRVAEDLILRTFDPATREEELRKVLSSFLDPPRQTPEMKTKKIK